MPGAIYVSKTNWVKIFLLLPKNIDNKWYWMQTAYKRVTYFDSMMGSRIEREYKTEKRYLIDELRDKNES